MIRLRRFGGKRKLRLGSLVEVFRGFWPQLGKSWDVLAGALLSMVGYVLLQILRPWPLKVVLDAVVKPDAGGGSGLRVPALAGLSSEQIVLAASVAILAIAGAAGLAAYGQSYLGAKAGQLLAYRLRRDVFRHVHRLSLSYHDRARTGDLVLRLTSDMNLVRNLLVASTLKLLSLGLIVTGVAVLMFLVERQLALVALGVFPLLLVTAFRFSRRIRKAVRKQRQREGEIAATSAESFGSVALVKIHGAEEAERERFLASHRRGFRQGLRATKLQAALERRVELLVAVGTCLVLWVGARKVMAGAISAGDLVLAVSYLGLIYKPMRTSSRLIGRLAKGVVAGERILEVLREAPEDSGREGRLRPEPMRGRVEFRNVSAGYQAGVDVLHDIDLTIEPGERIALVGRSGAGKTTFARLVPRLYAPSAGTILVDGIPVEEIDLAYLRDRISYVLQETILFGLSIWDNITYGREDLAPEVVELAATRAGIHERILRLPDGYDTILEENGRGLSGGERQRVALARAFTRESPIVILDEPDTFLDASVREDLWQSIAELTQGRTSICIVHDVENAALADRIVVLDGGRIVGEGPHEALLAGCDAYRELWEAHARGRGRTRAAV